MIWSGRSGSNRRHLPWQGSALPTELRPHCMAESIGVEPIHRLPSDGLAIRCLAARPTLLFVLAETVRFELTDLLQSTVFKTVAINQALPHFLKLFWLRSLESNQASWINSPPPTPCLLDRNITGTPKENRTPLPAVKGRCPNR